MGLVRGKRLENVDRTQLVLVGGKLVLQNSSAQISVVLFV